MSLSWTRVWLSAAVVLAAAGCSSSGGAPKSVDERKLVSLWLTPGSSVALVAGQAQTFQARGEFSDGTSEELTSSVSWSSSDTAIVSVSEEGRATGVTVGSAQLLATLDGVLSNAPTVTVSAPERPVLTLWPTQASVPQGEGVAFIATLTQPDGSARDATFTGTWTSSNPAVFMVGAGGIARGMAPGTALVTVSKDGVTSNTSTITVRPLEIQVVSVTPKDISAMAGETRRFTATAHLSDGTTRDVTTTASWVSSQPGVVTVSADGVATADSPGYSYISAIQDGVSGSTLFYVTAAISSIYIIPDSISVAEGEPWPLIAYADLTDGGGVDVTRTATWASSDPTVAVVEMDSDNPRVRGVATGHTLLTASQLGVTSKSVLLSVRPRVIRSISVTPSSASMLVGSRLAFTATATLIDGTTQDVTATAWWRSSDWAVAFAEGNVTYGRGRGKSLITATQEGVSSDGVPLTVED